MPIARIHNLSARVDQIINFQYDDDEDQNQRRRSLFGPALLAAGAGAGGVLAHQGIKRAGGYASAAGNLGEKVSGMGAPAVGNVIAGLPRQASKLAQKATPAMATILSKLRRLTHLSSKLDEVIEFKISGAGLVGAFGGTILGGNIGRIASGKKFDRTTGKWVDAEGNSSRINWPVEASSVAGSFGGYYAAKKHGAPVAAMIKKKANAGFEAAGKSIARDSLQGEERRLRKRIGRVTSSALKAARYA